MITLTILTGFVREMVWGIPKYASQHGAVPPKLDQRGVVSTTT
jgi:hypothetical protein